MESLHATPSLPFPFAFCPHLLKVVEPGPDARVCACGQRGCLEAYASGAAVATIAKERLQGTEPLGVRNGTPEKSNAYPATTPPKSSKPSASEADSQRPSSAVKDRVKELERRRAGLTHTGTRTPVARASDSPRTPQEGLSRDVGNTTRSSVDANEQPMSAADVFDMASKGDEVAAAIVNETCGYLGLACLNICRLLDPDAILLTGGMAQAPGLLEKVRCGRQNRVIYFVVVSQDGCPT